MTPNTVAIILAGGQGTRMRSQTPKVLHDLCGRPMLAWPVAAVNEAGIERVIVVGGPDRALEGHLPAGVELAVQQEPRGSGDAAKAAIPHLDESQTVVILNGDVPLVTPELITELLNEHRTQQAAATIATVTIERDPPPSGRVIRDDQGQPARIVETKTPGDATPEELQVKELNAGLYVFEGGPLKKALAELTPDNAQGEYYLTDTIRYIHDQGLKTAAHPTVNAEQLAGVNDRVDLAEVRAAAQRRIHITLQRSGVTIIDPASTLVDVGVELGEDTVVEPGSFIRGNTRAGRACRIGPSTTLIDATLGDRVSVTHSYLQSCEVLADASVGPFAYLRPGTTMREGSKAGTFVEIKNSDIGAGAKVPHLSYIGDADVGENTNLGASTITANYDGRSKHRTTIGANVKSSVHVSFVAPVTVGDRAYTAAGSVITDEVPPGSLAIARPRQVNKPGYAERRDGEAPERRDGEAPERRDGEAPERRDGEAPERRDAETSDRPGR